MMRLFEIRTLAAAVALFTGSASLRAQQPTSKPTPEQARALLQARPELVEQLRQKLVTSGMSREQIHARLRAEGYPEDLLDPYLPGSQGTPSEPTSELYGAVQELGIADSSDVALLRGLQADTLPVALRDSIARARARDSTFVDSTRATPRKLTVRTDVEDSLARLDSGYNIFGIEMFRSNANAMMANVLGPVDENYKLGPGDRLVLILTGDVEASYTLDVTREGFVVIPQVGQIYVANLTLGQLNDLMYSRLGRVYSGVRRGAGGTTRFSISVARLRTNQVYVLGEVARPGSYLVSSAGTALTSLYSAGGPTANGSMRQVQIKRAGHVVANVDLYDYLLRGDASHDARLESGDIVFVPPHGPRVRVVGEVVRPGTYEMMERETLAEAISAAGGFKADALRDRVHIQRITPAGRRTIDGNARVTLEASDVGNGGARAVVMEDGDVVRVLGIDKRVRNTITVEGNVWTPGRQGVTPGTTLSEAIHVAGGPKPDVYLGQILVSRLLPDSSRVQLRSAFRDTTGAVVNDFPLNEDDVIQVFSLTDFRPDRYVAIGGAVRKAGRFPYRRGMTMRDLVLLAGGLRESAYLKEAEIARLPQDRTGNTTATTIRVPLDSTYLFERKPGEEYLGAPGLPAPSSGAPEVDLQPYDNVLIMQQPNWELQRVVTILGEVKFPGQYALKTRSEHIAELIDRAGGLTTEAYPEGATFVRKKGEVGRVAVDVSQAVRRRGSPENLLLMDGDEITIPVRSNVVTVRGAVNAPNVVAYVPGKDLGYYVDQAGGPAREADYGRAYVTQPSGKRETRSTHTFLPDRSPKPLPGSTIVVPQRDLNERAQTAAILSALAPLFAAMATVAAILIK